MKYTALQISFAFLLILAFAPAGGELSFREHVVRDDFNGPWFLDTVDMDGDEDTDLVSASRLGNQICWWENDGNGQFSEHIVSSYSLGAMGIKATDLDQDGDVDIICALDMGNSISWWENQGNDQFQAHQIAFWQGPNFVTTCDLDQDEDLDILATACGADPGLFGWFENDGEENFTENVVNGSWDNANSIFAADLDLDQDMDLLGTASFASELCWYENDNEENFTEHVILGNYGRPSCVRSVDLDQDEDQDLLVTICGIGEILWFENDGAAGFTQRQIASGIPGPHSVKAADMDNDGDLDVLVAAKTTACIYWFEDLGGQDFSQHIITDTFGGASDVCPFDADGDGDLDAAGVATFDNEISWWENDLYGAGFSVNQTSGISPLEVDFTDQSAFSDPIVSWQWDFENDGVIDSYEQHPSWIYSEPGVYSVRLEVETAGGYHDQILMADLVETFESDSAIRLFGESAAAIIQTQPELDLPGEFTLESWILPEGGGTYINRIFDKEKFSVYYTTSFPVFNPNSIVFQFENTNGVVYRANTQANSLTPDAWQHLSVSYDQNGDPRIRINGIEQVLDFNLQPEGPVADHSGSDLIIGNNQQGNSVFEGTIDEVRIWDRVRTPAEIQTDMLYYLSGNELDLVSNWQFNEACGNTVHDLCGNILPGTLVQSQWVQGLILAPVSTENEQIPKPPVVFLKNHPNPFNSPGSGSGRSSGTEIIYELRQSIRIELSVFNLKGQKVKVLVEGIRAAGKHSIAWDGRDESGRPLPAGLYLYKLSASGISATGKMMILK